MAQARLRKVLAEIVLIVYRGVVFPGVVRA